ncbi:MAG TPA: His-Xaa-Ser system protein HxsD [Thermoanaerobaculia bacterium]|nr:His-Xaa-Ser system protein HxsD [Thermoanaerobaculia bacterium]
MQVDPAETQLRYAVGDRVVVLRVDETLYPLDAIYGAAYIFIDRCFVLLSRPADQQVDVRLKTKEAATEAELEKLAGEFANELLNQALRHKLAVATMPIREQYMSRAFFVPRAAPPTIDAILAELDAEELAGGVEVQVPWKQR